MRDRDPIAIAGIGAVTPVGLSAEKTCAAIRAGVSGMLPHQGWQDGAPPPPDGLTAGRVPLEWLHGGPQGEWPGHERWKRRAPEPHLLIANGHERLIEMAATAAEEAWQHARVDGSRIGLYLGLDDEDHGKPFVEPIASALGVSFEIQREDRLGRAAALAALHRAARHLRTDRVDVALVGGVDSQIRRRPVDALAADGMLRSDDVPHGIIPGEAAGFLVLASGDLVHEPLAWLESTSVTDEPTAGTDDPNQGVGLTRAIREARAAARRFESLPAILCDLNGERYRAMEWGLVRIRAIDDIRYLPDGPGAADLWHPADCIGDTGAASGALNAILAITAMRKGYAKADRALIWGASNGPLRTTAILSREWEN
jgi:3-oxoacyl-[acyl-carrier-protein] synthase-1